MMYPRGLRRRLPVVALLLVIAAGLFYLAGGVGMLAVACGLTVGFMALAFVARWFFIQRNVNHPDSRKVFDSERVLEFREDGVHVTTSDGLESHIPWALFSRAEVCGGFTLMFMTAIQHLVIAPGAFASPHEEARLQELLRTKGLLTPLA